ncbi:hypothetical protein [Bacillus phage SPO1L1]|nr:hypothetical protein [Bacillus phage SPO1L1]WIT26094.1 hypothetical protein [Bacillus phage SPO1L2]
MADTYNSYIEMAAVEGPGAFRIRYVHHGYLGLIVLAIHGGGIEGGTSEIAEEAAHGIYSLYAFEGRKSSGNSKLHLTSIVFDAPFSRDIVRQHDKVLSVHGYEGEEGVKHTLIGGTDREAVQRMHQCLTDFGFSASIVEEGGHLGGTDPDNIANLGITGRSVQLEISLAQRKAMFDSFTLDGRPTSKNAEFDQYLHAIHMFNETFE